MKFKFASAEAGESFTFHRPSRWVGVVWAVAALGWAGAAGTEERPWAAVTAWLACSMVVLLQWQRIQMWHSMVLVSQAYLVEVQQADARRDVGGLSELERAFAEALKVADDQ